MNHVRAVLASRPRSRCRSSESGNQPLRQHRENSDLASYPSFRPRRGGRSSGLNSEQQSVAWESRLSIAGVHQRRDLSNLFTACCGTWPHAGVIVTNLMPVTIIGCQSGLIESNISPRESGSQAGVGSSRGVPFQGQKIATFRPSTKPHVHDRYHPRQVGFCICLKNRSSRKTIVEFFRNAIGQVDSQKWHLVAN